MTRRPETYYPVTMIGKEKDCLVFLLCLRMGWDEYRHVNSSSSFFVGIYYFAHCMVRGTGSGTFARQGRTGGRGG